MKTIHKYYMHPESQQGDKLNLTEGYKILHFAYQSSDTAVWVEIDLDTPKVEVHLRIIGTGHYVPEGYEFCGTAVGSVYVWHLYKQDQK